MQLTKSEENKNKVVSLAISIAVFTLLILFLIFYTIITPNPPFPLSGGGGGTEINFGTYNEGTGNVENNGIGDASSVVEETQVTPPTPTPNDQSTYTSDNGEPVDIKETKPKVENNQTVITTTKPVEIKKQKTTAELLADKFNKQKGQNGGGDGNSGQAGNDGSPDGNPNTHGNGGTGGGDGGGNGSGIGPGKGPGNGGYGFSLAGRAVLSPPPLSKDTKEEGKVVVEITVDKTGRVIKADPNGRGTSTNSAILKAKARQAALATKFNISGEFEEQKGTITISFSF